MRHGQSIAVGLIAARFGGGDDLWIHGLSLIWIGLRVIYLYAYVADFHRLRTISWCGDVGGLLDDGVAHPMISLLTIVFIGVSIPHVSAVSGTPLVDGDLNDAVWQSVSSRSFSSVDSRQRSETQCVHKVAFAYDQEALYIAVWANDPLPPRVVSFERDRLKCDDKIRVLIDTYDDDRNAYLFATNPAGVLWDSQIGGNGRQKAIKIGMGCGGSKRSFMMVVGPPEFLIPFASLRLPERSQQTWGLNVERFSASRRETVRWKAWERGARFEQVARAGTLRGLQGPPRQLGLVLKPYGLVGFGESNFSFKGVWMRISKSVGH